MKLRPKSRSVAAILACAAPILLLSGGAPPATQAATGADCVVGTAGYPTIQSAVNSPNCHVISVPAGTFRENVDINKDSIVHTNITIRGAGPDYTIIDGGSAAASVFYIHGERAGTCGEPQVTLTLQGMAITGGTGPWCPPETPQCTQRNGGGVASAPGVKLRVDNCKVYGNSAYMSGGGISASGGRLTVVDSVVSGNTAFGNALFGETDPNYIGGGGGLHIAGCPGVLIVTNTVIEGNISYRHGGGVVSVNRASTGTSGLPAGTLVVDGANIHHNTAAEANGGGGIYYGHPVLTPDLTLIRSKIKNNYPDDLRPSVSP